MSIKKTDILN